MQWRGDRLRVTVDHAGITFAFDGPEGTTLPVSVHGRPVELMPGTTTVPLEPAPDPSPVAAG